MAVAWPKGPTWWTANGKRYVSIPFTWNLPEVRAILERGFADGKTVYYGGPAPILMPDYLADLENAEFQTQYDGVLQRINPNASRTTLGCVRACGFCGVKTIEPGGLQELEDWPDKPILCDNNILASSDAHFERVIRRLRKHKWCDFNQGLDARLLTEGHAEMLRSVGKPECRLACDSPNEYDAWEDAYTMLRCYGIAKSHIKSLILIGYNTGPKEAWERCEWVESHGVSPSPMWFHPLDALRWNEITPKQKALGWSKAEQRRIMGYFYQRRGERPAYLGPKKAA